MAYSFSEQATLDGYVLFEASLNQYGLRAADRYFEIMLEAAQFASDHPLLSPERTQTSIRVRVRYFGAHLLVYQMVDGDVVIRRIFHQSQDWAELV